MTTDLYHFGDQCAPGIIIDDILKQKKKKLFMLAVYLFNDILKYLTDNELESIYDKQYFKLEKSVVHTKYNFIFNHDYQIRNNKIHNYDHIKNRFNDKINDFKNMLENNNTKIFITFTGNIDALYINEMMECLNNLIKNKKFYLIIFSDNAFTELNIENVFKIKLDNKYDNWWVFDKNKKMILYKEIYTKFINVLTNNNIPNNFPKTIEQTNFSTDKDKMGMFRV